MQRVLDRRGAHQRISDLDPTQVTRALDAVEPQQPLGCVPGDRPGVDDPGRASRPGADKELGSGERIELAQGRGVDAADAVGARRRPVQTAEDIEQRRFTGARRPGNRYPIALIDAQMDIREGMDGRLGAVPASDAGQVEYAVRSIGLRSGHGGRPSLGFSTPTTANSPAFNSPASGVTATKPSADIPGFTAT